MTLEGAKILDADDLDNIGYRYKRLPDPVRTGIYECNSRCKCAQTCLNRVAQHPLQLKLQVFKTYNRGWGIRALNDVAKGSFICVYAGNLLTDATANEGGLIDGDEYLADLDYIEVVENLKNDYEADIPEEDKILDRQNIAKKKTGGSSRREDDEDEENSDTEKNRSTKNYELDGEFRPDYNVRASADSNRSMRLRARQDKDKGSKDSEDKNSDKGSDKGSEKGYDKTADKISDKASDKVSDKASDKASDKDSEKGSEKGERNEPEATGNGDDDTIMISDDEDAREPSRFAAPAGLKDESILKYISVRKHYGEDECCYIMDAKVRGNIGRYLNHSCAPNVFVQNVFVDTHDPRFPWVAFFALCDIRAGTELTWNYNYDVGCVNGKVIYCRCGAPGCRGRLL